MNTFKYGDKLRTVRNVGEDGDKMEGGLAIGDVVTMMDRTSYNRPFIIVERADGRKWQLEADRFELLESSYENF